jgi:tetratricopeptide (TPR) repeat protein
MNIDDIKNALSILNGNAIQNLLSGIAIIFSVIALLVTVLNNRLTRRQSLTETLAELAKIQLAALELRSSERYMTEQGVSMRRVHSLQRRFYAELGTRLIKKLPDGQITDIDYNLLATACNESGLPELAEKHWIACVDRSPGNSPLLAMNRRALARFNFLQGRFEQGREHYQKSIDVDLPEKYDGTPRLRADTYRMWAREEIDAGFPAKGEGLMQLALAESLKIKHTTFRREQEEYIALLGVKLKAAQAMPVSPAADITLAP